jgi:hypothetical protein
MTKRTAAKPVAKRQPKKKTRPAAKARPRRDDWAISNPFTEEAMEASLLLIPEEHIREETAFWSWPDSPEGDLWFDISDALEVLLKDVGLDAKKRKFLWPDAGPLDFDKSVQLIKQQHPDFPEDKIAEFLIFWVEALYEPKGCSDSQMDELDRLTERWVAALEKGKN